MSPRIAAATALRVVWQIRRDPRTILLLVVVPCVLLTLLKYVLTGQEASFQHIAVPMLGLFPLISMFLVTSITMLRERSSGTLERLMTLPLSKLDILVGYALAFGIVSTFQALAISGVGLWLLDVDVTHPVWIVISLAIINALLGMALGLFLSALARTEFQAVQFMPAFIFPQLLLCGLLVARDQMATVLEVVSNALPMTYAYDALERVASPGELGPEVGRDVVVTAGYTSWRLGWGRSLFGGGPSRDGVRTGWAGVRIGARPSLRGRSDSGHPVVLFDLQPADLQAPDLELTYLQLPDDRSSNGKPPDCHRADS